MLQLMQMMYYQLVLRAIALNSGTIKDTADGSTNAAVAISGALGTAAGTLTVTA